MVQSCSLTEEGAEAIARVAEKAHLKELNLYMNDIGDAGIFKVSMAPFEHILTCTKYASSMSTVIGMIVFIEGSMATRDLIACGCQ